MSKTNRRPFEVTKDPNAVLPYSLNWAKWLATGETITQSTWTLSPSGLTEDSSGINTDGDKTTIWLSGGVAGSVYLAKNHITTSLGGEDDRTIRVHCVDR